MGVSGQDCLEILSLKDRRGQLDSAYWGLSTEKFLCYFQGLLPAKEYAILEGNDPSNLFLYLLALVLNSNPWKGDSINWKDIALEVFDMISDGISDDKNSQGWGPAPFDPCTACYITEEGIQFFEGVNNNLCECEGYLLGKSDLQESLKEFVAITECGV